MIVGEVESHPSVPTPASKSLEMTGHQVASGYLLKALIVLVTVSLVRMIVIADVPLTGDEAYYWQWSRHPALGYHDHPPLVGWLIWASSRFGGSAFWVRFPSIVLSFLSSLFLFLFTREVWQDERSAFRTTCLFVSIPVFSISALAIFPDAPLVFSWAFFLWASWKWRSNERYWPWMGLALGLACLSKLMGLFLLPSLMLFLGISDKRRLASASLWKAVGLAFFVSLPFLVWNFHHQFETFTYQPHQRLTRGFSFSPSFFLNYASLQFVSLSPLVLVLFVTAAGMLFSKAAHGDVRSKFLLAMALPIHFFFICISFFSRVGLHWALPGYLSILAAVPVWVEDSRAQGKRWPATLLNWSFATSLAFTLFLLGLLLWPGVFVPRISSLGIRHQEINHGKTLTSQAMAEIFGYQELGDRVRADLNQLNVENPGENFVLTDSYSLSSIISFYAKLDAKTLLFTSTGGEYDRWNHLENFLGREALYVDTQPIGLRPDISEILHRAFKSVELLPPLTVQRGSIQTGTFYFAHCKGLVNPKVLRPNWPW